MWKYGLGMMAGVLAAQLVVSGGGDDAAIAAAPPEDKALFKEVDLSRTDLSEAQARILERIKAAPTTAHYSVVRVDPENSMADAKEPLLLEAKPDLDMRIEGYSLQREGGAKRLRWIGKGPGQSVFLTSRGKDVAGLIYSDKEVFNVEPIGGGLHAVIQLDQTRFPPDEPESEDRQDQRPPVDQLKTPEPSNESEADDAAANAMTPVKVLVAYTPEVERLQGNVPLLIDLAIDLTNASYGNSNTGVKLELAHVMKVAYAEAGLDADLTRFTGKNDGHMDDVHGARDAHGADICVLLIDSTEACGKAAAIRATDSTAFAVVVYNCAAANLSFPHEIGHLQGARHNPEVDPTTTPFKYGHGYLSPMGNWRTIMAYPRASNPNRVPYWSSPLIKYPPTGEAMGTTNPHDNARVLRETAAAVSAFRP